jgi:large subunit ribosomal protein L10
MVKQYKIDEIADLTSRLQARGNVILTNYSGIKVKDLSVLRDRLREKNAEYKVVKNNLFLRALNSLGYSDTENFVKGPIGVTFIKDEVGEIAKILKDFAKEQEKFSFSAGIIDKIVYNEEQIKKIADLPSKDVLIAQTMMMINAPATYIATGMNQVMASLARGINAVAEANNK